MPDPTPEEIEAQRAAFIAKLRSLHFGDDQPKTHQHKGDPWDGNPVLERVQELQKNGAKYAAMELGSKER